MEEQYYADRTYLRQLVNQHPTRTIGQYRAATGRSCSWVKKWRRRLREAQPEDHMVVQGQSRARKTPPETIHPTVIKRILELRDNPPEQLQRIAGPKAIIYYLQHDPDLQASAITYRRQGERFGPSWIVTDESRVERSGHTFRSTALSR